MLTNQPCYKHTFAVDIYGCSCLKLDNLTCFAVFEASLYMFLLSGYLPCCCFVTGAKGLEPVLPRQVVLETQMTQASKTSDHSLNRPHKTQRSLLG